METKLQNQKPLQAFNSLVGRAKLSKGELLIRRFFKFYYSNEIVFYNYRPDWLKNEMTGKNLELDIYYPNLKMAAEFQGLHHKLNYQIKKDGIKKRKCEELGIKLLIITSPTYLFQLRKILRFRMFPRWLVGEIRKYRRSKGGKFKKYVKYTEWKLKRENATRLQDEEIRFNRAKIARRLSSY